MRLVGAAFALAAMALSAVLPQRAAQAQGVVAVTIHDVRSDRGVVRVELCTQEEGLNGLCRFSVAVPARPGDVEAHFDRVPPGAYAAWAWHDEAGSGHLSFNLLGIPREGVGYSTDPEAPLPPPAFGRASFDVGVSGGGTSMHLHYHRR